MAPSRELYAPRARNPVNCKANLNVVGEPDKDANGRAKDPRDAGCAVMVKRSGWGTERPDEVGTGT